MATVEELLRAAAKADKAGDTVSAAKLVQAAKAMMPAKQPEQVADYVPPPPAPADAVAGQLTSTPTPKQPDTFGGTVADATAEPRAALSAYLGGLSDQSKSPTMAAIQRDIPGMPAALRPAWAAVGDIGMAALSGLGVGYSGAAGLAGEALGGSPTNEAKLARDLMMMGQVAVPELAGVSGAALGAGKVASAAAKLERPATERQAAARAASDLGIVPSLGMGGKTAAMTAAGMEKLPISANIIAKDAARAVRAIEGAFAKSVARIGEATGPLSAGERLKSGLSTYVDGFKAKSGKLFEKVDRAIAKGTAVQLPNTAKVVSDTKQYFAENPALASKLGLGEWDAVMAEAAQNGMPWQAVKQFRSAVGKAIGDSRGALKDEDTARLSALYGSLTADMEAAARAAGPSAYKAWKAANGHYRTGATRIDRYLDKTITADSPERAFEAFNAMTKRDRSSGDITRMREIKTAMPEEDWRAVSASIVDRLGRAPSGKQDGVGEVFSPSTFLTKWNDMSPEAKALLLPNEVKGELDQLALVAARAKSANAERNFSNTGTTSGWLAVLFGSAADMGSTATALGVNAIGAKALTSETFLKAMNRAARGDAKQLAIMARGGGAFSEDARTILRVMAADSAANSDAAPMRVAR